MAKNNYQNRSPPTRPPKNKEEATLRRTAVNIAKQDSLAKQRTQERFRKTIPYRAVQGVHRQLTRSAPPIKSKSQRITQRRAVMGRLAAEMAAPYRSTYTGDRKTVQGVPGRRGRPVGSVEKKYAAYGGVFGYRRYLSAQKKALRLQQQQQLEQMRQANQPQYEQQQYQTQQTQQLPPELQGQNITPEYAQYQQQVQQAPQQVQPQYQRPAPQVQPEIKREIKPVFKSSGGHPYEIPQTGLARTRDTIPYGYVEAVDGFTGRRYMKPLPKKENWT